MDPRILPRYARAARLRHPVDAELEEHLVRHQVVRGRRLLQLSDSDEELRELFDNREVRRGPRPAQQHATRHRAHGRQEHCGALARVLLRRSQRWVALGGLRRDFVVFVL